jgi:erythromycin esterase
VAVALALLLTVLPAEGRHRAVRVPESPVDTSTPAGWLFANARVLHSTRLIAQTDDLEPLLTLAAAASVVGLGDVTHGTHEVQTVKLRMIDVLVRDLGFDVLALEAPFPLFNRLNTYVQGGGGDPRALLAEGEALAYTFWNTEELLEIVEWMRAYNANRGARPAIEIAGVDLYEEKAAAAAVVAYLEGVDSAAAQQADADYACVQAGGPFGTACRNGVTRVRTALAQKESQYTASTSARAFHDALQYATIVVQAIGGGRDPAMAENVLWMRAHRGTSGKVIFWAHNEHVSEGNGQTPFDAGARIATALGNGYVTVATMAGRGAFFGWKVDRDTLKLNRVVSSFPEPAPQTYEWNFRQRGASVLFVPLRGVTLPPWLAGPAQFRWGSIDGSVVTSRVALPSHFDAVVFVDDTTPLRPLA